MSPETAQRRTEISRTEHAAFEMRNPTDHDHQRRTRAGTRIGNVNAVAGSTKTHLLIDGLGKNAWQVDLLRSEYLLPVEPMDSKCTEQGERSDRESHLRPLREDNRSP